MSATRIVLASTSHYRAGLLRRLFAQFETAAPDVDECVVRGELPRERALRLAVAKAAAIPGTGPAAVVIGSDQVAARGDDLLHKPETIDVAREQLRANSGRKVDFYTAVCVLSSDGRYRGAHVDRTRAVFRRLADSEIDRYLALERPVDCAGSFKVEGAGIALFESIESIDPTALIGLPLIALARMLREAGVAVP